MNINEKLSVFKQIIKRIDPVSYENLENGIIDIRLLQYAVCYDHEVATFLANLKEKPDGE